MSNKKVMLLILDGWGKGQEPKSDAIFQANTPFVDGLYKKYANSNLVTFGEEVGLPEGQMGNSEVGHLNLGAGRVVYQELARINKAIRERTLHNNKKLLAALALAKKEGKAVHFMGLVSDGGVHSHINHIKALCDIVAEQDMQRVFIHAFMDGRDTDPKGGKAYLAEVLDHIAATQGDQPNVQVASVVGRYYAMDRDKRWERIKLAYDLLLEGKGEKSENLLDSIQRSYDDGKTDEFILPIARVNAEGKPLATIQPDDIVLFFNFRTDRPRQLTTVLTQEDMPEEGMKTLPLHKTTKKARLMRSKTRSFVSVDAS